MCDEQIAILSKSRVPGLLFAKTVQFNSAGIENIIKPSGKKVFKKHNFLK